jgi:hypothetical protein
MVQDFGVKWSTLSGAVGRQRFDADRILLIDSDPYPGPTLLGLNK